MLGERVGKDDAFADVPTALKAIVGRLDDYLQGRESVPDIRNPVLRSEKLTGAWDDTKYKNFREVWHRYRGWIDDAFDETNRDESIAKWRRVFGDDFAGAVVIEEAASVSSRALVLTKGNVVAADAAIDLVDMVRLRGELALPPRFTSLPHMRRPTWPLSTVSMVPVIRASYHGSRNGQSPRAMESLEPFPGEGYVRFDAVTRVGSPLLDDYEVHWRITNTDRAAAQAKALRGDFYRSDSPGVRWERLEYRGVHMAEAFVVRKRNGMLLGQSAPFFVVIE